MQLFNTFVDSHQLGRTCLCADDVGIVLKNWFDLVKVFKVFNLAERAAGLKLKPRKCFLVPISAPYSLAVVSSLRDFLSSFIPSWFEFNITCTAEYLGIWLGPGSASRQWCKPELTRFPVLR